MVQDQYEADFLLKEMQMLERRYTHLKDRDSDNFYRHAKLFAFLILYGAGPYLLPTDIRDVKLLRAWGLGGLWIVISVLVYFDRDFRAYGLHLKERIYCLYQISVIRQLFLGGNENYSKHSVLPQCGLQRPLVRHEGFPEYLAPSQIQAACYFFKFLGLFPILYGTIFLFALFSPEGLGSLTEASKEWLITPLFLSGWIYVSSSRCLSLQITVFEARRIRSSNPWPTITKPTRRQASRESAAKSMYRARLYFLAFAASACVVFYILGYGLESIQSRMPPAFYIVMFLVWFAAFAAYFVGSDAHIEDTLKILKSRYEDDRIPDDVS